MLKIRLSRIGKKHTPIYRIVVAEHTSPVKGRSIDTLGTYDNSRAPKSLKIDISKYNEWISKGAKPSETIESLVNRNIKSGQTGLVEMNIEKKLLPKAVKEEAPVEEVKEEKKEETPTQE